MSITNLVFGRSSVDLEVQHKVEHITKDNLLEDRLEKIEDSRAALKCMRP